MRSWDPSLAMQKVIVIKNNAMCLYVYVYCRMWVGWRDTFNLELVEYKVQGWEERK
jgi:hypothetical protein